jgi:type IV pilus assembly protein PilN
MRVTLNLATRPFADLGPAIKRLRIGMGILAALAIALLLGLRALHQKAEEARARDHSLDAQIAQVTAERANYQAMMRRPENAQLLTQAEALNKLFDDKAFSWTLAMENLETVLPSGVQVSTLQPIRDKEGVITLQLRVIGPHDRSVELVRNLEHSRRFLAPRIVGENSEAAESTNQRLVPVSATNRFTFDLLAEYNPPTPEETRRAGKKTAAGSTERFAAQTENQRTAGPMTERPGAQIHRPPYTGPALQRMTPYGAPATGSGGSR